MTAKQAWIGKAGPFNYDDAAGDVYPDGSGDQIHGLKLTGQGLIDQPPTLGRHIVNLDYLNERAGRFSRLVVDVVDITDPTAELGELGADSAGVIITRQPNLGVDVTVIYAYDARSADNINSPYRVAASDGGTWVALAGYFSHGTAGIDGNLFPSTDNLYYIGTDTTDGPNNLRWNGRFYDLRVHKTPAVDLDAANKAYVDSVAGSGGVARVQFVSVADISNPTFELTSVDNSGGNLLVAYQSVASGSDFVTLYRYDTSPAGASPPYIVAGSGGRWVAIAGRFTNGLVTTNSTLTATALAAVTGTFSGAVTTAGINTHSGMPGVFAYRATTQAIDDSTTTKIVFATERFDVGNRYNNSTGEFTCPSGGAGLYRITAHAAFAYNATGQRNIGIFVNSTEWAHEIVYPDTVAGLPTQMSVSCLVQLAVADVLSVQVNQNSGGSLNLDPTANANSTIYLSIEKVA